MGITFTRLSGTRAMLSTDNTSMDSGKAGQPQQLSTSSLATLGRV